MVDFTLADLISQGLTIREKRAELKRAWEKEDAALKADYDMLTNAAQLLFLGDAQSIKTDAGTAYKADLFNYKVADREAWFKWVEENQAWDMVTTHLASEQVDEWVNDHNGQIPEGLSASAITVTRFRKT